MGVVLKSALLLIVTLLYLTPLLYALMISLKSRLEAATAPLAWPSHLHFENYTAVAEQMNYLRAVLNTIGITAATAVLIAVIAPLAAYPIARLNVRWTNLMYQLFIVGLTIPFFMVMVPLYGLMRMLGLINTQLGVILLYTALNLPLAIFFYTSFLRDVPRELEEAAAIDGCGPLGAFRHVVLPLLRPVAATLTMFVTLSVWNDFLLPLVFLYKPEARTIMVSVYSFVGQYGFDPTNLFPAAVLGSLPLLVFFLILQRQIIAGIAAGAVKG
ncbi:carbohydrate ABC transporter permease (plasmid) [Deinococcus sp. KNUC1210]|uniref:carbohydrate ABC transporter permease n=1 Tax=Deinococcus sp. KNUC1210 TaxID=2917691 RepID=UPI001EF05519|nr:carbohydrate ABC transporter permease [Deinococcus sp. KNUC1210]ULH18020.1 carbohydrate ABC transporter permease [Deinococcus sp. KNUC1210]